MLALIQQPRNTGSRANQRGHRPLTIAGRIARQQRELAQKRRYLMNMAFVFCHDPQVYPLQCSTAVEQLLTLCQRVQQAREFLLTLDPEMIKRVKPNASIDKLTGLDYLLTEITLHIAMLAPICQQICYERIDLHLQIRSLFPRLLATFEDACSQLAALADQQQGEECCDG